MKWYMNRPLRRVFLGIFSRVNPGAIVIRHHYTGKRFHLHSYRHKGYWFHGKNREQETMRLFRQLIAPGNVVIEIGGHIGYISTYFASLVEPQGVVHVFEPGTNNLPYLRQNAGYYPNIHIHTQAVGSENKQQPFYIENLTGQNNSLRQQFAGYTLNAEYAFTNEQYEMIMVDVICLDDFLAEATIQPHFIKIDVEGAECDVVRGMKACLETYQPGLMIEFNSPEPEIFQTLTSVNYKLFDVRRRVITHAEQIRRGNIFALHNQRHANIINALELQDG